MIRSCACFGLLLLLGCQSVAAITESSALQLATTQPSTLTPGQRSETGKPIRAVATDLYQRLAEAQSPPRAGSINLRSSHWIGTFYQRRDYQPAWLNERGRPGPLVESLLRAIDNAVLDGLRPESYHSRELHDLLRSLRIAYAPTVRQLADIELLLSDAFLTYAQHLLAGRLDPRQVDNDWILQPRSENLALVLDDALAQRDIEAALARLLSPHPDYAKLRAALAEYRQLAGDGGWPMVPSGERLEQGDQSPGVLALRARLRASGDLVDTGNDSMDFDAELDRAVRRFQARHGLTVDGIVGPRSIGALNVPITTRIQQLEVNLERLRWLPADLGRRHILVNVPGQYMSVVEDGRRVLDSRVVVGQRSRATPIFTGEMSYLVFSPFWHIPRSIAVRDKLPLLQRDPYALQADRIRIFRAGQEIDPGTVDWHSVTTRNFNFTLRQDPGPRNALGGVKFMFPNHHSVYIHDTPSRSLFNRSQRALSSGCVRTDIPLELAQYLLRDQESWTTDRIRAAMQRTRERRVDLTETIPVHLQYWTAWADTDGTIHFRDDIYGRDSHLAQALYSH